MTGPHDADGPRGTAGELLPEVYDELRKLAKARLARERHRNQTLQPTALVHEAYLRVSGDRPSQEWDRRGHFFAAAAWRCGASSWSGPAIINASSTAPAESTSSSMRRSLRTDPALDDLVAVDQALTQLEKMDPRKAKIVALRYFAGLSVEETAKALDLSPATIKNEWAFARAWLYRQLGPPRRATGRRFGVNDTTSRLAEEIFLALADVSADERDAAVRERCGDDARLLR